MNSSSNSMHPSFNQEHRVLRADSENLILQDNQIESLSASAEKTSFFWRRSTRLYLGTQEIKGSSPTDSKTSNYAIVKILTSEEQGKVNVGRNLSCLQKFFWRPLSLRTTEGKEVTVLVSIFQIQIPRFLSWGALSSEGQNKEISFSAVKEEGENRFEKKKNEIKPLVEKVIPWKIESDKEFEKFSEKLTALSLQEKLTDNQISNIAKIAKKREGLLTIHLSEILKSLKTLEVKVKNTIKEDLNLTDDEIEKFSGVIALFGLGEGLSDDKLLEIASRVIKEGTDTPQNLEKTLKCERVLLKNKTLLATIDDPKRKSLRENLIKLHKEGKISEKELDRFVKKAVEKNTFSLDGLNDIIIRMKLGNKEIDLLAYEAARKISEKSGVNHESAIRVYEQIKSRFTSLNYPDCKALAYAILILINKEESLDIISSEKLADIYQEATKELEAEGLKFLQETNPPIHLVGAFAVVFEIKICLNLSYEEALVIYQKQMQRREAESTVELLLGTQRNLRSIEDRILQPITNGSLSEVETRTQKFGKTDTISQLEALDIPNRKKFVQALASGSNTVTNSPEGELAQDNVSKAEEMVRGWAKNKEPIDPRKLSRLNEKLTTGTKNNGGHAGESRFNSKINVGCGNGNYIPSNQVLAETSKLCEWINHQLDEANGDPVKVIKIAAETMSWAVSIHPFIDGNGRTCRMLTNYVLMRGGLPPAILDGDKGMAAVFSEILLNDSYKTERDRLCPSSTKVVKNIIAGIEATQAFLLNSRK